jgi:uncharacterized membrane protein YjgN (DUF898 family)
MDTNSSTYAEHLGGPTAVLEQDDVIDRDPPRWTGSIPEAPIPEPSATYSLRFHGNGGELFGIFILNLFKTILTFGLYSFWAKVKTRQYLWNQTEFAGDRFAFHGTGKELLIGALKAGVLYGGLVTLIASVQFAWANAYGQALAQLIYFSGLMVLIPLAQIGSMRYRLSRTSWRGVRLSFRGDFQPFLKLSLRGQLLTSLTLGLYMPHYDCDVRRFMVEHTYFGSMPFRFDGKGADLVNDYAHFLFGCLLAVMGVIAFPPLIISYVIIVPMLVWFLIKYLVHRRRYYWNHTSLGEARFESTIKAEALTGLYVTNLCLILLSLGLAQPWAKVRTMKYNLGHLSLHGLVDFTNIAQHAHNANAAPAGDELAGFLGIDTLAA